MPRKNKDYVFTDPEKLKKGIAATRKDAPKWTMGGRNDPDAKKHLRSSSEPPMYWPLDYEKIKKGQPTYTLGPRNYPPDSTTNYPGPGKYKIPSNFDDPTIKRLGVPNFRGEERKGMARRNTGVPGPGHYGAVNVGYAMKELPRWTMQGRGRPQSAVLPQCGADKNYDVCRFPGGKTFSLVGRPNSATPTSRVPGPGHYKVDISSERHLSRYRTPGPFSFGSGPRFPDDD
jgi:hypothetical protein